MAFVQVTLIKFKKDTDQSSIVSLEEGLKSLSKIVPGITKFEFGPDLKIEIFFLGVRKAYPKP